MFFTTMCLIITNVLSVSAGHGLSPATLPDQYFDSYGDIPWGDEKAHLDNFAFELKHDQNLIGYIIVYAGRRACLGEAQDRALRAKNYLVKFYNIQKDRIRWIDGGYQEDLRTVLQPIPLGAQELTASPTLKSSDVVIRNCKPKIIKRKARGS
jgi:hypothetical protein